MASAIPNNSKKESMDGAIDYVNDDIRAILVMSDTTCDTEVDGIDFIDDYTTLDELDAGGYAREVLAGKAVAVDDGNDRAEFDANDESFAGLGGDATRTIVGVLIYKHVTNDTDSIPLFYSEFASPLPITATQIDIPWNIEGLLQLA
jgi:hypothetical protein